ncbi:hypothetical protein C5167_044139 [Papaver somniferum]|uniref:Serine O-acetyltransferase n=1 Tax=Papaver somniferum TaxID=3469 RepID=A0A4Y7LB97_PAPSO|nr:hypothetical protein C5167_044139 [Papaver somniferum]
MKYPIRHHHARRIADVSPFSAEKIGKGILFDHATGVVVGETAVIGNNVSILHHRILGFVKVLTAKIGAGSVVLIDVPARTTAAGNPARFVSGKEKPGESMDHTSFISEWSDYI